MTEMKKHIYDESNGLWYELIGDYYIPILVLTSEEQRPIGKWGWGRMHREYLREHCPILLNDLILCGQLWTYLASLNEQAQRRLQLIIRQMQEAESVNEEMKASDQMAWVGAMNNIRSRAEEITLWAL